MTVNPSSFDMNGVNEDVFFLSNGHISPVCTVSSRVGDIFLRKNGDFRKLNSRLQGHPATEEGLPGIRVASGSLGQGLSVALCCAKQGFEWRQLLGLFFARRWELQEGQIWEAAMYAAHHRVDNLISFVDCNGQQIDGSTDDVMFWGFGWKVEGSMESLDL